MKLMTNSKGKPSAQKLKQESKTGGIKANTNATYQSPSLMTFGSKNLQWRFLASHLEIKK